MTAFFTNPPAWPTIVALGCVGAVLLIALTAIVVNIPPKETPMSAQAQRVVRTFIQAFLGAVGTLVAAKLVGVASIEDLSGLASAVVPIVTAGVSAGISAVMLVVFPPKP